MRWAGDNADRLQMLRTAGTHGDGGKPGSDLGRALDAIGVLADLDPEIAKAVAELITSETDLAARVDLLRALTTDTTGRYVTGEVLHERTRDRLTDARNAAQEFDSLLETECETVLQRFLESNPWLLGLDYAQIRARQPIPRGAVDFLLERFDGFHDLLELKGPGGLIFETHGNKAASIPSPSSYRLSRALALALAQVHAYRDALHFDTATEDLYGLPHTREPRIIILIGRASELGEHQKRLLRELNRSLHRVEIMPFDVIGRRARAMLDNVERYLLTAEEEAHSNETHPMQSPRRWRGSSSPLGAHIASGCFGAHLAGVDRIPFVGPPRVRGWWM